MNVNEEGHAELGAAARRQAARVAEGKGEPVPQLKPTVYRPTHGPDPSHAVLLICAGAPLAFPPPACVTHASRTCHACDAFPAHRPLPHPEVNP
jgi:hypothetical protein